MKIRVGNKQSHSMGCYASGGRVAGDMSDPGSLPAMAGSDGDDDMAGIDGGKAKTRLDRAGKKSPSTTINVIVAGKSDPAPGPMPAPPMAPPMAGPPGPPSMPPMGAGGPPMMRKNGGRVMTAGAGSGIGRLEKIGKK